MNASTSLPYRTIYLNDVLPENNSCPENTKDCCFLARICAVAMFVLWLSCMTAAQSAQTAAGNSGPLPPDPASSFRNQGVANSCDLALPFSATPEEVYELTFKPDGPHPGITAPGTLPRKHAGSRFALGFKASTLGLGADFGARLSRSLTARIGVTGFNYHRLAGDGDIAYDAALRLRSVEALVDWFPTSWGFHLSPGVLLYNGTRVSANAVIPTGKVLTSAAEIFVSNPKDPITGSARTNLKRVAPMALFGFGRLVPGSRKLSFSADFGIVFQGLPQNSFKILGSACDVRGLNCRKVARDASIQTDVRSGEQTMQDDLSFMKYYPVVSLEFGYRF